MLNFYVGIPDAYRYYITAPLRPNPCPFAHSNPPRCLTKVHIGKREKSRKIITFKGKGFKPNLRLCSFLIADSQYEELATVTDSLISRTIKENVNKIFFSKSDVWLTVHRNSVWIRKTN